MTVFISSSVARFCWGVSAVMTVRPRGALRLGEKPLPEAPLGTRLGNDRLRQWFLLKQLLAETGRFLRLIRSLTIDRNAAKIESSEGAQQDRIAMKTVLMTVGQTALKIGQPLNWQSSRETISRWHRKGTLHTISIPSHNSISGCSSIRMASFSVTGRISQ